ncbi:hypothetical protein HMPREF1051_2675 [Neisseria sicca VK64]|mgnify:FL=1|uniref:Uncharacterized protein n=1 Tax=Neisseria sicca VK64 TaxID=1095748 RepID=I2NRF1_NEISI|nr:hypothetical protein HMPREF1051_2675 [Neisseria sicca VK64]
MILRNTKGRLKILSDGLLTLIRSILNPVPASVGWVKTQQRL